MHPRTVTRNSGREWKCVCGGIRFRVVRTEHDEENLPIRIRQCRNCGEALATEERPISLDAYWGRAATHRQRNYAYYKKKAALNVCRWCSSSYRVGTFRKHVESPDHLAYLTSHPTPASRRAERSRAQRDYWKARGFTHLERRSG